MAACKTVSPDTMQNGFFNISSRHGKEIPKYFSMHARMRRPGTQSFSRSIALALSIAVIFTFMAGMYWKQPRPCEEPVTYRIGHVDPRFGLSRKEVAGAIDDAASIWEKTTRLDLFQQEQKGAVEIIFVYDYRQEAADKLKGISGSIDNTKSSYDDLKARYESLKEEYEQKETALTSDIDSYNVRMHALKAESDAASQQGGAPEDVYKKLMAEKEFLDSLHDALETRRIELNNIVETLNRLAEAINEIANNLNLEVVKYNRTGEQLREEFSQGLYEKRNGRQTITVFHFNNRDRLVRVLAHELGHALGLSHNNNTKALMYRLNQTDSLELTAEDIAALQRRCTGG